MADYPHQAASEQHIRLRQQSHSQPHPPQLLHQLPTHSAHNPWAQEAALEAHLQQGLERQRLKSLQDSAANPPL